MIWLSFEDVRRYKLSLMIRHRVLQAACLCFAVLLIGCKDKKRSTAADTAAPATAVAASGNSPSLNAGWDASEAGPIVMLADSAGIQASVVLPSLTDSMVSLISGAQLDSAARGSVDLFDRSGAKGTVSIAARVPATATEGCTMWPTATLHGVTTPWRVGFIKGVAQSLPLDSLEGVSAADSVMITTQLARLASIISADSDPVYQGLPFSVRKAYRFNDASTSILVGSVVRKINEEANPREEHILLIAEKSASTVNYVTAFHTRAAGAEDMVRTSEILALVRFTRSMHTAMVVSFEYEDGGRVALIERTEAGTWKMTWRSAYTGC